jgi:colicin import membrane protein
MSEVGALIVKLQAETAQFREDMGKVKSDLDNLKPAADGAGEGIKTSMEKARGGLMIVEESTGVRLPRALTRLIAGIPGVGAAFSTMLPLLGVMAAIVIIDKLIEKHKAAEEAMHKVAEAAADASIKGVIGFTNLGDKLIEAQNKADELAGDHLGALRGQLELLDHASLKDLIQSLQEVTTEADKTFEAMFNNAKSWYDIFGQQTTLISGAKSAWDGYAATQKQFYADQLAAEAKVKAATNPAEKIAAQQALDKVKAAAAQNTIGTIDAANKNLAAQNTILKHINDSYLEQGADAKEIGAAWDTVGGKRVIVDQNSIAAQQQLITQLNQRKDVVQAIANIEAQEGKNVKTEDGKKDASAAKEKAAKAARELAEADRQEAVLQKAAATGVEQHSQALIKLARSTAEAAAAATKGGEDDGGGDKLADQKKLIEQERDFDIQAAQAALAAKKVAYYSDIKEASLTAKQKETLTQDWKNDQQRTADEIVQFNADANKQIVAADRAADNERAASDKALVAKEISEQLSLAEFTAQIGLKADEQAAKNKLALHQATAQQTLKADIAASQAATNAEVTALQAQLKALDTHDKKYLEAVVKFNADVTKAEQKGEADVTALKAAALQKQLMDTQNAENKMKEAISSDIASSIVMNKSLAASFRQTGEQMAEQMIKNLLMMELTGDKEKLINAKAAYGRAFKAMAGIPPAPMWGYAAGAAAFASVMSFEVGGKIPGEGAVPIVGHGGETVVTKALTDRVESSEHGGSKGGGMPSINYAPQIHAVDATGVDAMLSKHASVFQRHITAAVRRMNK